jgi:hypothetical protein
MEFPREVQTCNWTEGHAVDLTEVLLRRRSRQLCSSEIQRISPSVSRTHRRIVVQGFGGKVLKVDRLN